MNSSIIPQNFQEWQHCIVVECGLQLTPDFINKRIASLQNSNEYHTQQFIRLYGPEYHQRVLGWFIQARDKS